MVRGSHGRAGAAGEHGPLVMSRQADLIGADEMRSVDVFGVIQRHLTV